MKNNIQLNKNKILLATFLILGVLITLLLLYTIHSVINIKLVSQSIYDQRLELERKYRTGFLLRQNEDLFNQIEPRLNSLNLSFVNKNQALEFINDLEAEAERLNLDQTINIPEISQLDILTPGALQLSLTGSPEKLLDFINILDKKPYYINIVRLKIINNKSTTDRRQNSATLVIEGTIYWQ